mmetsp:Transcript_78909/g.231609  ORF Transcript_78909/g.231609 Transcript_78909/m.231609 type:complete len:211 (-) Transcript_78909:1-633(-)
MEDWLYCDSRASPEDLHSSHTLLCQRRRLTGCALRQRGHPEDYQRPPRFRPRRGCAHSGGGRPRAARPRGRPAHRLAVAGRPPPERMWGQLCAGGPRVRRRQRPRPGHRQRRPLGRAAGRGGGGAGRPLRRARRREGRRRGGRGGPPARGSRKGPRHGRQGAWLQGQHSRPCRVLLKYLPPPLPAPNLNAGILRRVCSLRALKRRPRRAP